MKVAIIDYGAGNLRSAAKAFERASDNHARIIVTHNARDVREADYIVLPGQGAFADCMRGLQNVPGMVEALNHAVLEKGHPFLGICVGMQLLAEAGNEHGRHKGLGWIKGEVNKLTPADPAYKVPHMGWNQLKLLSPRHALLKDLGHAPFVYFLHSYALDTKQPLATADYAGPITAMVANENIAGTQFHPEKSQKTGLQLIANFLDWRP